MAANKTSSLGAAVHGMADARLARLAADYEIPLREPGRPTNHGYDPDWLYDQYVNQARPLPAIAKDCGVSTSAVSRVSVPQRGGVWVRPGVAPVS